MTEATWCQWQHLGAIELDDGGSPVRTTANGGAPEHKWVLRELLVCLVLVVEISIDTAPFMARSTMWSTTTTRFQQCCGSSVGKVGFRRTGVRAAGCLQRHGGDEHGGVGMGGVVMDTATTEQMSSTTNVVMKTMPDTRRLVRTDRRCGSRRVLVLCDGEGFLDVIGAAAGVGFVVVQALEREVENELGVTGAGKRLVESGEEVKGTAGSTTVALLTGGDAPCLIRPPEGRVGSGGRVRDGRIHRCR